MAQSEQRTLKVMAAARRATVVAISALMVTACSSDDGSGMTPQMGAGTSGADTPAMMAGTGAGTATSGGAGSTPPATAGMAGTSGRSGMTTGSAGTPMATGGSGTMPTAGMGVAGAGAAAEGGGGMMAGGAAGSMAPSGDCTREMLATAVQSYYKALSAHDPMMMNPAPSIKLTEDGKAIMPGEGLMKTAGMVKFTRSALDTLQCETVTESVVENEGDDFVVGTRLRVAAGQITEVESILVGPEGWFPNPEAILDSASDDWEKPLLPESERSTRDQLKEDIVDAYFVGVFGGTIPVADYPFASSCNRMENGFSPGACDFGIPTSMPMTPLHYVIDDEAGIAAGFVLFGGRSSGLVDFHMFRVKNGEVYGVHAVVGPRVDGRGWPDDPAGP